MGAIVDDGGDGSGHLGLEEARLLVGRLRGCRGLIDESCANPPHPCDVSRRRHQTPSRRRVTKRVRGELQRLLHVCEDAAAAAAATALPPPGQEGRRPASQLAPRRVVSTPDRHTLPPLHRHPDTTRGSATRGQQPRRLSQPPVAPASPVAAAGGDGPHAHRAAYLSRVHARRLQPRFTAPPGAERAYEACLTSLQRWQTPVRYSDHKGNLLYLVCCWPLFFGSCVLSTHTPTPSSRSTRCKVRRTGSGEFHAPLSLPVSRRCMRLLLPHDPPTSHERFVP